MAQLGVNIDHVATLRNARGGIFPDPITAALIAEENGADGITAHLREDRRHIRDQDMRRLKQTIKTRLNMEMAATPDMVGIALDIMPYMVTLVPERREELTTEGGLNVLGQLETLTPQVTLLQKKGIRVSLFIDASIEQTQAALKTGAEIIEFHTGPYCEAFLEGKQEPHLTHLMQAAQWAVDHGIEVNAGHGLNYENVSPILTMPGLVELNIGHSLVGEAIFSGLASAVRRMKDLIST